MIMPAKTLEYAEYLLWLIMDFKLALFIFESLLGSILLKSIPKMSPVCPVSPEL